MSIYLKSFLMFAISFLLTLLVFYVVYKLYLYISIELLLNYLKENGTTYLKW